MLPIILSFKECRPGTFSGKSLDPCLYSVSDIKVIVCLGNQRFILTKNFAPLVQLELIFSNTFFPKTFIISKIIQSLYRMLEK